MENGTVSSANMRSRTIPVFVLLAAGVILSFLLSLALGSVKIPVSEVCRILAGQAGETNEANIILQIRLPRALMAAILGGALALSGFMLQTFFANPIAGPYVLGISSGAKMMVALVLVIFVNKAGQISSWLMILAAFSGAMAATGLILLAGAKVRSMTALLVAGIMIGYIFSAVTEFLITFASDQDIVNLHGWSQGSFSGMSWDGVRAAALTVGIAAVCAFFLSKPMHAYLLGENYAASMGVNIRSFRVALILISSILSACVTAFAGPISFVGIAVPYLARRSLRTGRPILIIPASFLSGALVCQLCDVIARTIFAPTEVNLSTVTAVFGAPVVICMLIGRRSGT